jgi:hypothetical protein
MTTIAARIKSVLFERLQQATIANGYATNMGLQAHRGRMAFAAQDLADGPRVGIGPPDDDQEEANAGRTGRKLRNELRLLVAAHALDDGPHPMDTADALLGDIKRAMLLPDAQPIVHNGQPLTEALEYLWAAPEMPGPGEQIVRVAALFSCRYSEIYGDPASV